MAGSRPLSTTLVPAPEVTQYSNLEVDHKSWLENDGQAGPIVGQDPKYQKITIGDDADKIALAGGQDEKIISYNDVGKEAVVADVDKELAESPRLVEERKIFGLRRKTFFILSPMVFALIIASAIGGGVGGTVATRSREQTATIPTAIPSSTSPQAPTTTRLRYANTGLAALQWTDPDGTLQKRLYYQDNNGKILESAWDNSTAFDTAWNINAISDAVKPGTPIAAAAGYPHASYNYPSLLKNVYYMLNNSKFVERQAASNVPYRWDDSNFSGLYSGINSTFLAAYWNQNIQNASQELVVLFQHATSANSITQGRYTSNREKDNPWVANHFGFSQPKGSTFALSLVSYQTGKHMMLYTVDDRKNLWQHEYTISDTDRDSNTGIFVNSESATGLTVEPRSPLAVVTQDNQPLHLTDTLPECTPDKALTNLIIFAVPDRSSLVLSAWNCTSGFLDHTSEIEPLQKANTTYLSLAAMSDKVTGDGNVYIMFDSGSGPQVEEWTVPKRAGDPWVTSRNVTTDFDL